MIRNERFEEAIRRIDAANREDPRVDIVDGQTQPREYLFAKRVYECVESIAKEPSESLLLAARSHTLRRWAIPREKYPMTTVGYHQWRDTLARFHAEEAEKILRDVGYDEAMIKNVKAFITKDNWPTSREACVLEDADCLVFLETKLVNYVDEWDEEKAKRILERTFEKMTPDGRARVRQLALGDRERALLERVLS